MKLIFLFLLLPFCAGAEDLYQIRPLLEQEVLHFKQPGGEDVGLPLL